MKIFAHLWFRIYLTNCQTRGFALPNIVLYLCIFFTLTTYHANLICIILWYDYRNRKLGSATGWEGAPPDDLNVEIVMEKKSKKVLVSKSRFFNSKFSWAESVLKNIFCAILTILAIFSKNVSKLEYQIGKLHSLQTKR